MQSQAILWDTAVSFGARRQWQNLGRFLLADLVRIRPRSPQMRPEVLLDYCGDIHKRIYVD